MLIDICIVGLGNPGLKYHNTRHNIGFLLIDKLAEFFNISKFITEGNYQAVKVDYKSKTIVLMKPLTYMNLSGSAVKTFAEQFLLSPDKFLIVFDDANLDFGTLRLRPEGSDGGHNGMSSVIYEIETEEIPRLRIGIKNEQEMEKYRAETGIELADFVLSDFTNDEISNLPKIIDEARNAVLFYIDEGITAAMNNFNKNVLT